MLVPKKTKYRKPHRLSYEGITKGHKKLNFGEFGIMSLSGNYVEAKQIEAARVALTRFMKRSGRVWINMFPHLARTQKPQEVRMGSGKGNVEKWVAVVKKGMVIIEVSEVSEEIAKTALTRAMHKLPLKCKIIKKD